MKKVLMILCALCMGFAYADNVPANKIVSSKEYVDDQLADKQTIFGANANNVAVFTAAAGTIIPKPITETLTGNGVSNTDLPTVGAVNSGLDTKQDKIGVRDVPNEYTQLEYIKSTGTQYINTGVSGLDVGNWELYVEWMITGNPTVSYPGILQAYTNEQTNTYRIILSGTSSTSHYVNGNSQAGGGGYTVNNLAMNQIHTGLIKNGSVTVDGTVYNTPKKGTDIPSSTTIRLFATGLSARIYSSWATKDGVYQYNMIPVRRNSDNAIGMYDTVTETFFTNSGTGTFIAGPYVAPIGTPGAVVTYTDTPGTLGAKGIYQDTGTYAEQKNSLVDAGTFNEALRTGLESEFVCANRPDAYDPVSGNCWLWEIAAIDTPGYTELDYIESTGTQYINTGVSGLNVGNWEIYVKWMTTGTPAANYASVIKAYVSETNNAYRIIANQKSTSNYYVSGNSKANVSVGVNDLNMDEIHTGLIKDGSVIIDDTVYNTPTKGTAISNSAQIQIGNSTVGRIYSSWATKNGVYQYNMIPVRRNSDGTVGMYDTVTNTFFMNSGTGAFIAGPVKNNNYLPQNQ